MVRIVVFGSFLFGVWSCTSAPKNEVYTPPMASNLSGEALAKLHCGSCHSYPSPEILPENVWLKKVLPNMGLRLGHGDFMQEMLAYSTEEMMRIAETGVYQEKPLIAKQDWDKIIKFYSDNAPNELAPVPEKKTDELTSFNQKTWAIKTNEVVMTQFDSLKSELWVGTSKPNVLYRLAAATGKILDSTVSKSPILAIKYHSIHGLVAAEVGILNPSDQIKGSLVAAGKVKKVGLHRPVHLLLADINNDKIQDFVVCNFGNNLGSLNWYDGKTFEEHTLLNQPGARVVYQVDFNKDGKNDLVALFTQGKEQLVLFEGNGNGDFKMKTLLEFPPYYGSSYFELHDLDHDNDLDIVYTCGDNADLSIIQKPFHGLRIFENQGATKFYETYFYPINGASKVMANDFDQDGDLDFAVISFFPYGLKEGFLYFENVKKYEYKVRSKAKISTQKWLTMDIGDVDHDGDVDIILGAFNRDLMATPKVGPLVLLSNTFY